MVVATEFSSAGTIMHYLYASKPGVNRKLVATFDSESQLRAYVAWATLASRPDGTAKFEQGSSLASYQRWEESSSPLDTQNAETVVHNPSPSML
jgi:hypothetical protein